ncbi:MULTISPECIES: helix-turn-helix domain-containing protein [unclassified Paenibacillus]|jgi:hypothetical protein|uniref:helix-turn-helix domain-containing protein n=1 Tax=unclassified Paenibacillus TaxID=185978 RepID=UPI0030F60460
MNSTSTLLHLAQNGDKEAEATLITRYEPVISTFQLDSLKKLDDNHYQFHLSKSKSI